MIRSRFFNVSSVSVEGILLTWFLKPDPFWSLAGLLEETTEASESDDECGLFKLGLGGAGARWLLPGGACEEDLWCRGGEDVGMGCAEKRSSHMSLLVLGMSHAKHLVNESETSLT